MILILRSTGFLPPWRLTGRCSLPSGCDLAGAAPKCADAHHSALNPSAKGCGSIGQLDGGKLIVHQGGTRAIHGARRRNNSGDQFRVLKCAQCPPPRHADDPRAPANLPESEIELGQGSIHVLTAAAVFWTFSRVVAMRLGISRFALRSGKGYRVYTPHGRTNSAGRMVARITARRPWWRQRSVGGEDGEAPGDRWGRPRPTES
jgi:hypothetical protein